MWPAYPNGRPSSDPLTHKSAVWRDAPIVSLTILTIIIVTILTTAALQWKANMKGNLCTLPDCSDAAIVTMIASGLLLIPVLLIGAHWFDKIKGPSYDSNMVIAIQTMLETETQTNNLNGYITTTVPVFINIDVYKWQMALHHRCPHIHTYIEQVGTIDKNITIHIRWILNTAHREWLTSYNPIFTIDSNATKHLKLKFKMNKSEDHCVITIPSWARPPVDKP